MSPLIKVSPVTSRRDRGTVLLVALCFVAVMGIVLGSYLAVCTRAMQLSNRGFQANLSKQLAEAGIDEALRAFNKNDWSGWSSSGTSVVWDTTTYAADKRAVATMTFPTTKFGQGVTAEVKVRVDNSDAHVLGSTWNSTKTYQPNDVVGSSGVWYSCIKAHSNQAPPNLNYWVPEGIPWRWDKNTAYATEDLIVYNESWYRCITGGTNRDPISYPSEWQKLVAIYTSVPPWPYVAPGEEALLFSGGSLVQLTYQSWGTNPPYSWRWRSGVSYGFNDVVYFNGLWYRSESAHTSSWSNYPLGWATVWSAVEDMWNWSSSLNYTQGDTVYHSSTARWYRCIQGNSNQTPSTTSLYWADTPLLSQQWNSDTQYSANDVVTHNGVWYLSLQSGNIDTNPATDADNSHWIGADTTNTSYIWNATTGYAANSYRCYDGVWYKCITATTANAGHTPNNTTYWTAAWSQTSGVTTGAPVAYAEAVVTLGDGTTSSTQLRAPISPAPLFPNAAGSSTTLTISSSGGLVDSYDYSLGTGYTAQIDADETNYSAVLAGVSDITINSTTEVRGYLAWPSPAGGISTGTTVKGPASAPSPNIDTSRVSRSPYVPQFDPLPRPLLATAISNSNFPRGISIPAPTASNQALYLGTPGATTPSLYYYSSTLRTQSGSSSYYRDIHINGPIKLYINGNLYVRSGSTIYINSAGSAEIHPATRLMVDSASNGIKNHAPDSTNPNPRNLVLICDRSGGSTQYYDDTTNPFHGVIYMPNTTHSLGLDIGPGVEIFGALSAREITFSGDANLHYDTSLRYAMIPGVDQPYTVTDWRELSLTEQATMP